MLKGADHAKQLFLRALGTQANMERPNGPLHVDKASPTDAHARLAGPLVAIG